MPQAVLHILIPLILAALFKDWHDAHHKNKLPLHYVLIAGIAGIIPDLDVAAFWILHFFGFSYTEIHRTFAHSLAVPLFFLLLFTFCAKTHTRNIGNLKLSTIFLALAFGSFVHIALDATLAGTIQPFYPFTDLAIGLNLVSLLPDPLNSLFIPSLEAGLLVLWLIYLELKHKISDFI